MTHFPTRILLATDGSECALTATRAALDLANRSGSELHVVHAFELVPPREYAGVALRLRPPSGLAEGKKLLDEQVERIEQAGGVVAGAWLQMGSPVDNILSAGEEVGAGLVIVGRRGLGGVKRLLLGSVSEGLVRRSSRPVLVLCGGEHAWPPARVVIADDSSEDAEKAGDLAASIGSLYEAEGSLVQVYPRPLRSTQEDGTLESKMVEHALKQAEFELRTRARRFGRILGSQPEVKLVVDEGADGAAGVASILLGDAKETGEATLISVGRRGLGRIRRARVGSVSSEVLRAAKGAVLA